jgi:hypothetical protein
MLLPVLHEDKWLTVRVDPEVPWSQTTESISQLVSPTRACGMYILYQDGTSGYAVGSLQTRAVMQAVRELWAIPLEHAPVGAGAPRQSPCAVCLKSGVTCRAHVEGTCLFCDIIGATCVVYEGGLLADYEVSMRGPGAAPFQLVAQLPGRPDADPGDGVVVPVSYELVGIYAIDKRVRGRRNDIYWLCSFTNAERRVLYAWRAARVMRPEYRVLIAFNMLADDGSPVHYKPVNVTASAKDHPSRINGKNFRAPAAYASSLEAQLPAGLSPPGFFAAPPAAAAAAVDAPAADAVPAVAAAALAAGAVPPGTPAVDAAVAAQHVGGREVGATAAAARGRGRIAPRGRGRGRGTKRAPETSAPRARARRRRSASRSNSAVNTSSKRDSASPER